ncbi:MAG: sn-glycerol-3-phosphate ABC transporter substrate-binding protein UgpB [Betaproteobacteria bacterium]|nr:sn-glycerol-3-phosphate ABC transporter substrate-binding protein UgpB [Betaproteobacteria bacterium]
MKLRNLFLLLALPLSGTAFAATEIQWWHSMTGALGDRVNSMAERFNQSQSEFKVMPVFKGNYDESMAAMVAATRAGNAPDVIQIFEVGTATMMAASGDEGGKKKSVVKPVYEVMAMGGQKFDPKAYVPAVSSYYTDSKGRMLSLPFNSSTPVFYYSKDAFKKAGLDPNKPPLTWAEVAADAEKLKASGASCVFTTGWQSWVQLENASAWHDQPFATKSNGFGGLDTKLVFNGPFQVKHIGMLADWQKKGLFTYGGRKNEPEAMFFNGECAMLTSSSAAYGNIKKNAKFDFAVSPLPYHADVKGAPRNTIIGGASLWVMAGKTPEKYKGIARFFNFISQPELQAEWHQATGYLPITKAAYDLTKQQGYYEKNPGTDISVLQMTSKTPTDNSRGIRLGNFVQIRNIIDEELESVWSGKKTAKQALDEAVERGNEQLRKFEKANK